MQRTWLTALGVLALLTLSTVGAPPASAQEPEDVIKNKLKAVQQEVNRLQQQIEALRKQEQALQQELAEKAKEKTFFIKVEVKGRLRHSAQAGYEPREVWTVTAQGVTWELDFGTNKEFLELARKHDGKTVQVTGTLTARRKETSPYLGRPVTPGPSGPGIPEPGYPDFKEPPPVFQVTGFKVVE
jgi:hypothetical protein